ncbi:MAG TPA: hypothetical protein VMX76_02380 [Nevskiaceae bacterium]|nr:hypothetical protein [Nevskiaceae bacterium]
MEESEEKIVKEFPNSSSRNSLKGILLPAGVILAIILAGTGTGYLLSRRGGTEGQVVKTMDGAEVVQGPKEVGIKDEKIFRDSAEGKIEVNDRSLVEEGSHRLIRAGGESQTAYLTSSVVDLSQFLGKCVEVWGETFAAQKAGWLMDVGRVKTLDRCPEGL